jgi:hypothetical protein
MRKTMLLLILLVAFLAPIHVLAQGEPRLSQLSVDIWPEYDQPAVLTIYHITLAPATKLPANLAIRIPPNAQINAVAIMDSSNVLLDAPYNKTIQGKWALIKIATYSLQVRVEYYMPLVKNGTVRNILFEWAGDYAVDRLNVNFQKPFSAESVSISIAPTDTNPGPDGLTNYHIQKANLAAGEAFSLSINYQRQTDDLSISSQPVQAASTPGPGTQGRVSMTVILPWILAGIGVLLIAAGVVGFVAWQRGGRGFQNHKKHTHHHTESVDEFTYCHQCGKRAQPGDVFCRTCGTRLKRGSTE